MQSPRVFGGAHSSQVLGQVGSSSRRFNSVQLFCIPLGNRDSSELFRQTGSPQPEGRLSPGVASLETMEDSDRDGAGSPVASTPLLVTTGKTTQDIGNTEDASVAPASRMATFIQIVESIRFPFSPAALLAAMVAGGEDFATLLVAINALRPELVKAQPEMMVGLYVLAAISVATCQYQFLAQTRANVVAEIDKVSVSRKIINTVCVAIGMVAMLTEGLKFFYGVYVTELQNPEPSDSNFKRLALWGAAFMAGVIRAAAVSSVEVQALLQRRYLPEVVKFISDRVLLNIPGIVNVRAFLLQLVPLIEGGVHALAVTAFMEQLKDLGADTNSWELVWVTRLLQGVAGFSEVGIQTNLNVERIKQYLIEHAPTESGIKGIVLHNGIVGTILQLPFTLVVIAHGLIQLAFNCSSVLIPSMYLMFVGKIVSQSLMICKAIDVFLKAIPGMIRDYFDHHMDDISPETRFIVSLCIGVVFGILIASKYLRMSVPKTLERQAGWLQDAKDNTRWQLAWAIAKGVLNDEKGKWLLGVTGTGLTQ